MHDIIVYGRQEVLFGSRMHGAVISGTQDLDHICMIIDFSGNSSYLNHVCMIQI